MGIERAAWRANGSPLAPNSGFLRTPPAFKFPVKPRALAMTTQGVEKRRKSQGACSICQGRTQSNSARGR